MRTSHQCPAPEGCPKTVPAHMLMCARHWYQVPKLLRSEVWAAWRDGLGAGTEEHVIACDNAIDSLKLGEPPADELAQRRESRA